MRRRLIVAVAGAAVALTLVACEYRGLNMPGVATLQGEGALAAPSSASDAITYNPALAPVGARLTATMTSVEGSTSAKLAVSGLLPNRGYAVHAHTSPCGATGDAAGPHFQHLVDPAATPQQPSTKPVYANSSNEIWLDVRTDGAGAGTANASVLFVFTDRTPASIMVHEAEQTATGPGQAGRAGAPVACLNLSSQELEGPPPLG